MPGRNYWPRRRGHKPVAQLAPRIRRPIDVHQFVPGPHRTGGVDPERVCDRADCGHVESHPCHRVPEVPEHVAEIDQRRGGE